MKLNSLLVPFDFSDSACQALEYAVKFIGDQDIELNILHTSNTADQEDLKTSRERISTEYQRSLKQPIKWILEQGSLVNTILETRIAEGTEMVLMGTSGLIKSPGYTNTAAFVSEAKCPVLVIPKGNEKNTIKNICLVVGNEEIDRPEALHILTELVEMFDAKVHVLTIKNSKKNSGYSRTDELNESTLLYYLENYYSEHNFLRNPDILDGIFTYVKNRDIDMIAVLPRKHSKQDDSTTSSLTKELVLQSDIPVLTIE